MMMQRGELLTAYTPYQPEMSQGVLQAIFEYQTAICELTGMEVSNASCYDGMTAAADACFVARLATRRDKVVVSRDAQPAGARRSCARSRRGSAWRWSRCRTATARTDPEELRDAAEGAACVIFPQPNFFGVLEDAPALAAAANDAGALPVAHVDLMTLGVLEAPGAYGCDDRDRRGPERRQLPLLRRPALRLPGRARWTTRASCRAGSWARRSTATAERAYVLTLQTREQHIRREKATSNITSNQTLLALGGLVTLSWLGPQGLREVGERSMALAEHAKASAGPAARRSTSRRSTSSACAPAGPPPR